jgi:hypothetical protein
VSVKSRIYCIFKYNFFVRFCTVKILPVEARMRSSIWNLSFSVCVLREFMIAIDTCVIRHRSVFAKWIYIAIRVSNLIVIVFIVLHLVKYGLYPISKIFKISLESRKLGLSFVLCTCIWCSELVCCVSFLRTPRRLVRSHYSLCLSLFKYLKALINYHKGRQETFAVGGHIVWFPISENQ